MNYKAADALADLRAARRATNTNPTEAQAEAGNYAKGKVWLHDLEIALENPKGSVRSGVSKSGKKWSNTLRHDYGYIKGTVGADKDHLDVFIGPDLDSEYVVIVNQIDPDTGKLDEHKVMLGFQNEAAATEGYKSNYAKGWQGLGSSCCMTIGQFHTWLETGDMQKPATAPGAAKTAAPLYLQSVESIRQDLERLSLFSPFLVAEVAS